MNAPEFNLTQAPEIKNPITKLADFITRQNEIQKQIESGTNIGKNHHKLLEKVLKFKMMLKESFNEDIDPITYLENLYYKEKLSMDSIVLKLKEMYIKLGETNYFYNSSSALQKFLVNVLNWKLRDASENKTTKVYKSRDGAKSIAKTLEKKDLRKVEFLSWYIKNSSPDISKFEQDVLNKLKFKYEQFIYLLEHVFQISPENFKKLKELSIGNQSFADRFNEIFDELKINFTIGHKDIARVFEKY